MLRLASTLAVLALATTAVHAEPNTTVAVQPMMLVLPMVDATIEYQPTPRLGLVLRPGYGHALMLPGVASVSFYEIGGAANVYLTRDFKGWHAGSELFWLWGQPSGYLFDHSSQMMTASAERVAGVYGGYKWIGWKGLTAVVQFGVGRLDQKQSPDGPISKVIPVGNLDVGWSF
jgi:hypothetical protein